MRRLLPAVAMAAALAAPVHLAAQATREPASFGLSGGLSLPTGDLKRELSTGYAIAGHLRSRQGTVTALRFRADVSFDRWAFQQDASVSYRSVAAIVNAHYSLSTQPNARNTPYLLGGLGVFNDKSSGADVSSDTNAGMQVGGGMDLRFSGLATFVEVKYVSVFAEGRNLIRIPLTFGVRF